MDAEAEREVRQRGRAARAPHEAQAGLLGVRSPLRRLQGMQQVTMLSHPLWPPRATGITWSKVSCEGGKRSPQYWQRWSSRA